MSKKKKKMGEEKILKVIETSHAKVTFIERNGKIIRRIEWKLGGLKGKVEEDEVSPSYYKFLTKTYEESKKHSSTSSTSKSSSSSSSRSVPSHRRSSSSSSSSKSSSQKKSPLTMKVGKISGALKNRLVDTGVSSFGGLRIYYDPVSKLYYGIAPATGEAWIIDRNAAIEAIKRHGEKLSGGQVVTTTGFLSKSGEFVYAPNEAWKLRVEATKTAMKASAEVSKARKQIEEVEKQVKEELEKLNEWEKKYGKSAKVTVTTKDGKKVEKTISEVKQELQKTLQDIQKAKEQLKGAGKKAWESFWKQISPKLSSTIEQVARKQEEFSYTYLKTVHELTDLQNKLMQTTIRIGNKQVKLADIKNIKFDPTIRKPKFENGTLILPANPYDTETTKVVSQIGEALKILDNYRKQKAKELQKYPELKKLVEETIKNYREAISDYMHSIIEARNKSIDKFIKSLKEQGYLESAIYDMLKPPKTAADRFRAFVAGLATSATTFTKFLFDVAKMPKVAVEKAIKGEIDPKAIAVSVATLPAIVKAAAKVVKGVVDFYKKPFEINPYFGLGLIVGDFFVLPKAMEKVGGKIFRATRTKFFAGGTITVEDYLQALWKKLKKKKIWVTYDDLAEALAKDLNIDLRTAKSIVKKLTPVKDIQIYPASKKVVVKVITPFGEVTKTFTGNEFDEFFKTLKETLKKVYKVPVEKIELIGDDVVLHLKAGQKTIRYAINRKLFVNELNDFLEKWKSVLKKKASTKAITKATPQVERTTKPIEIVIEKTKAKIKIPKGAEHLKQVIKDFKVGEFTLTHAALGLQTLRLVGIAKLQKSKQKVEIPIKIRLKLPELPKITENLKTSLLRALKPILKEELGKVEVSIPKTKLKSLLKEWAIANVRLITETKTINPTTSAIVTATKSALKSATTTLSSVVAKLVTKILEAPKSKLPKTKVEVPIKIGRKSVKKRISLKKLGEYMPSLAALVYNIVKVIDPEKAKYLKQKVWTGIELRPIVVVKKK